jgi:hypothetical protein
MLQSRFSLLPRPPQSRDRILSDTKSFPLALKHQPFTRNQSNVQKTPISFKSLLRNTLIEEQRERVRRLNAIGIRPGATPLEFLQAVYCNEELPLPTRIKAAIEAAPYVHPKLAVTGLIMGEDFAQRLEKAIERAQTQKAIEPPSVTELDI